MSGAGTSRPREFVQSLARGLDVIRAFDGEQRTLTIAALAERTGLPRAAARRFLMTLEWLGYVSSDGREYALTPRVLTLGSAFLSGLSFPDVALPHLERLVAEVHEASEASILDGHDTVYVARVPGPALMTVAISVGARLPAHATSMGQVLLAGLPAPELDEYLRTATLTRFLPATITDPERLREQLITVRRSGYAIVDQHYEEGLLAAAAPVHDRHGAVCGAINLSTHVARWTVDALRERLVPVLLDTAARITADMAGVR